MKRLVLLIVLIILTVSTTAQARPDLEAHTSNAGYCVSGLELKYRFGWLIGNFSQRCENVITLQECEATLWKGAVSDIHAYTTSRAVGFNRCRTKFKWRGAGTYSWLVSYDVYLQPPNRFGGHANWCDIIHPQRLSCVRAMHRRYDKNRHRIPIG